jgi:thioredoxin-dependent peroxiredoxin
MPPHAEEVSAVDPVTAANIELLDQHGNPRKLAKFHGRYVVVYFYPKDDTPGCTVEGKEFRDLYDKFVALECAVVGVSSDRVESHSAFAKKHALPFTLLADPTGELARAFGVWNGARADRVTFVIGPDGRVRRTFREVAPRGHAQQVLTFVRALLESHRMLGG